MPKQLPFRLKVLSALFGAGLLILFLNSWFLSTTISESLRQQAWVDHTHRVLHEIEAITAALVGAESEQRGYMLRPEAAPLEIRSTLIDDAQMHLTRLRELVTDNSDQKARVEEFASAIDRRIALMNQALNRFQTVRTPSSYADFAAQGRQEMVRVRKLADDLNQNESKLLRERTAEAGEKSRIVFATLIGSTILNVVVLGLLFTSFVKQMRRQATEAARKSQEAWIKASAHEAGLLVAGDLALDSLSSNIARFVKEKLGFPLVNVYLESSGHLRANGNGNSYRVGEGLVGQAAEAESFTFVDDVPPTFFSLSSQMGAARPSTIVFVPLKFRGELAGLLELATFHRPDERQIAWIEQIREVFGASLVSARGRSRLNSLLTETQRQAEELQMQQEELRTTNEELEEQTKALLQSEKALQSQTEELRQVNEELETQARSLESQQESLNLKNQALETSRKRIEEKAQELERANQYKSEFLAKMSHELRTPLNSVMILATIFQENKEKNLNQQQIDFAKTIRDAGQDLLELINDILDLSKLEAKKLQARPELFSTVSFIKQLESSFRPQAESKNIGFKIEISDGAPKELRTDRQRLQQIVRNLVSNALKFTEKGEVKLQVTASEGATGTDKPNFRVSVTDTGIGIPEDKKQLIWEAFEQADGSVSRRYGGTGLGLTISRELAALLGGQITIESEEGKGSCFTVEIPTEISDAGLKSASTAIVEKPIELSNTAQTSRNQIAVETGAQDVNPTERGPLSGLSKNAKTLLIIEDDLKFRDSVAEVARSHGFTPLLAESSGAALKLMEQVVPHAILLDTKLSDVEGLNFFEKLKKTPRLRHVPLHMISASDYKNNALRLGAVGFLASPVTVDGVRAALTRIESVIDKKVKRLLIVEDDETQNRAINELVAAKGTEVLSVSSGHEAAELLKAGGIDCMVLDLKLPDMSGFELLESLGGGGAVALPPVIVYTGKDLSPQEEDRLRRYSDSIIIKGAKSPERLLDEVNLFLHRVDAQAPEDERRQSFGELGLEQSEFRGSSSQGKAKRFAGKSVLLVDDDLRNLFALTSALEAEGFKVTVARNGIEALEKLQVRPETDLVLMDIMMPKMDGLEAMKRIRAQREHKDLPMIALTAKAMKGEQERCIEAGANDYLPKPINLTHLLSLLSVWVPGSGAHPGTGATL